MKTKHTPGPWFYDEETCCDDGSFLYYRIHDGKTGYGDDTIAQTDMGIATTDQDKPEQLANARLIASAPELLEALEKAYYLLNRNCPGLHDNPCSNHCLEFEAVIAKARGGL